jgi:hypothetical protein
LNFCQLFVGIFPFYSINLNVMNLICSNIHYFSFLLMLNLYLYLIPMILINKKVCKDRVRPHSTSPICGKGKPIANLMLYHLGRVRIPRSRKSV